MFPSNMLGGDDRRPFDGVVINQVRQTPTLARGSSFTPPPTYMAGFRRPDFVPGPRLGTTTELGGSLRFNRNGLRSQPRSPQLALNGSLNKDGMLIITNLPSPSLCDIGRTLVVVSLICNMVLPLGTSGESERPLSPESPYLFPIRPKQGEFAGRESRFAWKPTWMKINDPQEKAPRRFEHQTSAACHSPSLEPLGREMEQTLETHFFRGKRGSDNTSGVRSMRGARRNGCFTCPPHFQQKYIIA